MTRRNYSQHIKYYKSWAGTHGAGDYSQRDIESYVAYMTAKNKPADTITAYLNGLAHYCDINDILINWRRIRKFVPRRVRPANTLRAYTDREVSDIMASCRNDADRGTIRLLCETGVRVGALSDIKITDDNTVIVYPDDIEQYVTFCSPLTAETYKPTPVNTVRSMVARAAKRAGVDTTNTQSCHAFRKRYNTILKSDNTVNVNIAEKLMGHKRGLDGTYFTPTIQQLRDTWNQVADKLIPK